ncbi:protein unc-13 homolog 4B-like isoform X2 [Copidosoma floridanum]|uniref:protein unc-13 homolog 4B-like isoform X2 n=1 Tax=Copidosoma floridanum TaxID=29053 RepID=UPI0006C94FA9|nr:protein unc-13 homolog 4B-like isoform X2 [Copidosoma floridanum]
MTGEDEMWENFYHKFVADQEKKMKEPQERSSHEASTDGISPNMIEISDNFWIQEEDNSFFEKLGTSLADKAKAQRLEESLPEATPPCDFEANEEAVGTCNTGQEGKEEVEDIEAHFCVAKQREALYAEKEIALKGEQVADSTESESENGETTYNVVAKSVGLNVEELYTALLYMIQHQIGFDVVDEVAQDDVVDYLQKAFNIDDETHQRVMEETRQMEAPKMHLNVEVMEAKELNPLDSNGKSDPFCVLYLESAPTHRFNTAVKPETLEPVWHEHFEMPLDNPENDVLHLEVWDFDAAESVPEKMSKVKSVKGMRGLVKLAKEIAITATSGNHDNEFIGGARVPLQAIPVTGHVMWYALEKNNKPKRRGLVKLRLAFSTEHNARVAYQEHRSLLRILLLHELESHPTERYSWQGGWSGPAEVVVLQHAVQRGLCPKFVNLARWIEFAAAHQEHQLSFAVFLKLAEELVAPVASGSLSDQETLQFWDACKKILYSGLNALRKIRRLQVDKEHMMKQLVAILRMISLLSSSLEVPQTVNLFPLEMYSWLPPEILDGDRISIPEALEFAVIRGGAERFEYIVANNNLESDSDEEALKYHIKIIQLVRLDLQRAYELYEKLFIKTINFPYTKTLYIAYEKRVSSLCMVIIEDICGRLKRIELDGSNDPELGLGMTLFELYLAIQRFAAVGQNFCPDELKDMKVQSYYTWFQDGVAHWLEIAAYKAIKRIERAVEFDNLQPVDSSVQYTSSAVDALTIFYQIKVFWTQLAWPETEGAYAFVAKIIDDICKCCIVYVDCMANKAEERQRKEDEASPANVYGRQFNVSVAWCYAINNIDYVRTSIEPLAKDLGLGSVIEALAENLSQQDADRCNRTLQLIIDNAKDTMKNKIDDMLESVARKMVPAMDRYLMEGAELSGSSSNSMDKLMEYLDQNLITLHDNLNKDNFQRILVIIWELMAAVLASLVDSNLERRRPPSYYSSLHKTLQALIQFFNFGTNEVPNVQVLERIEKTLKLYGMETNEVIHRYYLDRLKEQSGIENEPHGMLTVKAYFFNDLLNMQILNARNLRSTDGSCNSYVKITLYPEDVFAGTKSLKTGVQKETQFPLYDESFNIPLTTEQRKLENAIIRFEVKDKDFLRTKFMAECFMRFGDIHEKDSHQGFGQLEQIHLKLSRPTSQSSEVINVLSRRKGDNLASNFMSGLQSKMNSS